MSLAYSYDEERDVLTVEGVAYSGHMFRSLAFMPIGTHFQLIDRRNDTVVVKDVRAFCAIHGEER